MMILGSRSESLEVWVFMWVISGLKSSEPHLRKYSILHRIFFERQVLFCQNEMPVVDTQILLVFDLFVVGFEFLIWR